MHLSLKLKKSLESHPEIVAGLKNSNRELNWQRFTRTQFNLVARIINRKITLEVLRNPDLVEMNLITGKQQPGKQLFALKCSTVFDFIRYLGNLGEYRIYNWISGKTLQSYWNEGEAKYIKINALLVFLEIPFADWHSWQKETLRGTESYSASLARNNYSGNGSGKLP